MKYDWSNQKEFKSENLTTEDGICDFGDFVIVKDDKTDEIFRIYYEIVDGVKVLDHQTVWQA